MRGPVMTWVVSRDLRKGEFSCPTQTNTQAPAGISCITPPQALVP